MNNLKYTIELDAKGKLIPSLRIVRQQVDAVTASVKKAGGQFEKLAGLCDSFKNLNFSSYVVTAQNLAGGLAEASKSGIGFEQAMADLKAITGIAGKDFETLADSARKVGRETGLGAQGAVEAYTLLASQIQIDRFGFIFALCDRADSNALDKITNYSDCFSSLFIVTLYTQ